MEQHYQTEKRTFVVVGGVCVRVESNEGRTSEVQHPAISCSLLGGVEDVFRKGDPEQPVKIGHHLVFRLSAGSGRNRLFSDTKVGKIFSQPARIIETPVIHRYRQTLPGV